MAIPDYRWGFTDQDLKSLVQRPRLAPDLFIFLLLSPTPHGAHSRESSAISCGVQRAYGRKEASEVPKLPQYFGFTTQGYAKATWWILKQVSSSTEVINSCLDCTTSEYMQYTLHMHSVIWIPTYTLNVVQPWDLNLPVHWEFEIGFGPKSPIWYL